MTAPPPKIFPELAQVGLHAGGSYGDWRDWTVHITTSQFFTLHCTTTISLTPLLNSTSRFSVDREKYTWFYYYIIPKTFVTTACKSNSSRKLSLFFTHYIPLQLPLSLNFAIHTFLVFVHGEIQSYKLWTRYFQGILGMFLLFSLYLFVCAYFSYKTLSLLRN